MLTREQFTKDFKKLLIDCELTITEAGQFIGNSQQNLSKKINNASFGYVDFVNLLDFLGYDVIWKKREK